MRGDWVIGRYFGDGVRGSGRGLFSTCSRFDVSSVAERTVQVKVPLMFKSYGTRFLLFSYAEKCLGFLGGWAGILVKIVFFSFWGAVFGLSYELTFI